MKQGETEAIHLVPPMVVAMMCGVVRIVRVKDSSDATLHYCDGTTETGRYEGPLDEDVNFFSVVEAIQTQRQEVMRHVE